MQLFQTMKQKNKRKQARKRGKNMLHDTTLNTLQKRTLESIANSFVIATPKQIEQYANDAYLIANMQAPTIFNDSVKGLCYAYLLSMFAQKALDSKVITVREYLQLYALWKKQAFEYNRDFGAFGDLFETLVRVCFLPNINFAHKAHLHVADLKKTDLISKKYGRIEIGQNGKTLQEGTITDYMAGNYNTFIYGVFDGQTMQEIFDDCICGRIEHALKIIKAYTIICNKYDFVPTLAKYRRGKIITIKSCKVMIQYNESLYNCVLRAIENKDFQTLETI